MLQKAVKHYVKKKLSLADVKIDGTDPWDIQVSDSRFYTKVARQGSLGFGESYMDGWFNVQHLDEAINRIIRAKLGQSKSLRYVLRVLSNVMLNKQSKIRSLLVGKKHYDLSNSLFKCMLDKRMAYSCGYWKDATNLDEAQEAKLELICKKIGLKKGMTVLDIGCGWGSFAKYAAEKYGVHVLGISISKRQLELAGEICRGLPVELRFQDYRDVKGSFDRIVSIGQMEHVGAKNHKTFMRKVASLLKEDGVFLLHTIGNSQTLKGADPWVDKYIFPNAHLPSAMQLAKASEGIFIMEDWHNFGADYDKTLMAWFRNFEKHWPELKKDYDERFYRMWKYYLLMCAGLFRARDLQLWQIVYTKHGVIGGYQSIR